MTISLVIPDDGEPLPDTDFTISNNQTVNLRFHWAQGGSPVDLSASKLRMQWRADPTVTDGDFVEFSTNNSLIMIDPNSPGDWLLTFDFNKAASIPAGQYAYDVLQLATTDTRVWRRQKGNVTVEQGVTR